jgi:hypothetical protein
VRCSGGGLEPFSAPWTRSRVCRALKRLGVIENLITFAVWMLHDASNGRRLQDLVGGFERRLVREKRVSTSETGSGSVQRLEP